MDLHFNQQQQQHLLHPKTLALSALPHTSFNQLTPPSLNLSIHRPSLVNHRKHSSFVDTLLDKEKGRFANLRKSLLIIDRRK